MPGRMAPMAPRASFWVGFIYLAVVLDAFSRRIIGWAMAAHLGTELVLEALNMALAQRRPQDARI